MKGQLFIEEHKVQERASEFATKGVEISKEIYQKASQSISQINVRRFLEG